MTGPVEYAGRWEIEPDRLVIVGMLLDEAVQELRKAGQPEPAMFVAHAAVQVMEGSGAASVDYFVGLRRLVAGEARAAAEVRRPD